MRIRWIAPLLLISVSAGCASPRSHHQDPFTDLQGGAAAPVLSETQPQNLPYKALDLVVIESVNTKALRARIEKAPRPAASGGEGRYDSAFDGVLRVLEGQFKTVRRAAKLEQAAALHPDLIAVLDGEGKYNIWNEALDLKVSLLLLTPDQEQFDAVRAQTLQDKLSWGDDRISRKFESAAEDIQKKIARALLASANLSDYAKARSSAPSAAGPRPPAAPAVVYHSEVDAPAYKLPERPDDFALVIGIEGYSSLPPAEFAERDAAAVRAHLLALGYPERNIIYLIGARAGKAGIEKYVESWLPRNVKEDSRVLVYFSGHGAPDTKTGQAYLVPWDGDPKFLEDTGYPIKRLYGKLNALRAKQTLVALDSCFSGAGGRSLLPKGARPLVTRIDTADGAAGKLVVLAASAADEITGTEEAQGHGLFTYYFLKGLEGAARDQTGAVTARSLYAYLLPGVQDSARRQNRDQTPQLIGAADTPFVLRPR